MASQRFTPSLSTVVNELRATKLIPVRNETLDTKCTCLISTIWKVGYRGWHHFYTADQLAGHGHDNAAIPHVTMLRHGYDVAFPLHWRCDWPNAIGIS